MLTLHDKDESLINFFQNDPKGKLLPEYYIKVGEELKKEQLKIEDESNQLLKKIHMIDQVINMQQEYAKGIVLLEKVNIPEIIQISLTILNKDLTKNSIKINKLYSQNDKFYVNIQKQKLIHILLNLFKNAKDAMLDNDKDNRLLSISIEKKSEEVIIKVIDNGIGIEKENLTKIFSFGFKGKEDGHGFGLHSCANFVKEMNGRIMAESEGINKGSVFSLAFSIDDKSKNNTGVLK
jgi:signal transduction histidine kinase